jgi:elongator complex protein 6
MAMAPQPPIPSLLAPFVTSIPPTSLTVVSAVLGATSNWLVLRFLFAALNPARTDLLVLAEDGVQRGNESAAVRKVVLVSFLRSWDFWRSEAKRLVSTLFILFGFEFSLYRSVLEMG